MPSHQRNTFHFDPYIVLPIAAFITQNPFQNSEIDTIPGEMTLSIYQACHNYVVIGATFTYFIIIQDLLFQLKCH